jgi:CMP-N,N'-diacetyllegionaminic acid synthase
VSIVALIPARGGSKRIPGKNIKPLGGKPLIVWTIEAAKASEIFTAVVVSTEHEPTAEIARQAGAMVIYRPEEFAADDSPDIWWVEDVMRKLGVYAIDREAFSILRPTSPFRTAATIRRAWDAFHTYPCSSLRAVEPVTQHPGKMWRVNGRTMEPLIAEWPCGSGVTMQPTSNGWHSVPTQTLPATYVQNASLEMAWTWCVQVFGTITGPKISPFFTEGMEGFDINTPEDFARAERHAATLLAGV